MAKIDFDIDKYLDQKLIDSMNEQMQPSDEVVSSLLAKIAELEASELKTVNMPEVEVKPKKRGLSAIPRRVWYYSSAIAASIVILFATFTSIGGDGIDKIKDAFDNIININVVSDEQTTKDNKGVVSTGSNQTTQADDKAAIVTGTDSQKNDQNQESKKDGKKNNKKDKNQKENQTAVGDNNQEGNDIDNQENQEGQEGEKTTVDGQTVNPEDQTSENTGELTDPSIVPEDQTPVEPPKEEKYEPVEVMTIEGNNYIVGSTAKTATLSEESSVSLEVPTNNGAPKKMMVKSLKSVSPMLMMAVMPDEGHEDEPVMLYTNADYKPENLAQFIKDADISSVSDYGFGGAVGLVKRGKNVAGWKWTNFKPGDVLETSFKENILAQGEANYVDSFPSSGNVKVIFESTSNSTGIVLYFTVTSTGYLNIALEDEAYNPLNEFTFFVGKDAARLFIFDVTGE